MIETHLAGGHDVVLPQMLVTPAELERFEACARRAGAAYVERVLLDTPSATVARFHRRGTTDDLPDPWHDRVRAIVAAQGGDAVLLDYHERLVRLVAERPDAVVVTSPDGDPEATYEALLASLP